jgi:hypothetical protein
MAPSIHVRTWSAVLSGTVTEMANAGRRGKVCRVLELSASGVYDANPRRGEVGNFFSNVLGGLSGEESYDDVLLVARALKDLCPEFGLRETVIRGIDAPRPELRAVVEGAWSARLDDDGLTVRCLRDAINEPTSYSTSSKSRTHEVASRVWPALERQATYSQACRLLSDAGIKIKSYCAVD